MRERRREDGFRPVPLNEWRAPTVQGGQPERIGVFDLFGAPGAPFSVSVHPSGRRIIFESKGTFDASSEVGVMENFLPASQAGGSGAGE